MAADSSVSLGAAAPRRCEVNRLVKRSLRTGPLVCKLHFAPACRTFLQFPSLSVAPVHLH